MRIGSIPGSEDPLEEGMATHSIILAWRIHMDRGARRATVHGVTKSPTPLKRLSVQGSRDRRSQHIRLTPSRQDCVHPLHFLSATTLCFLFTISKTTHSHMPLTLHYFNGTFLFCFLFFFFLILKFLYFFAVSAFFSPRTLSSLDLWFRVCVCVSVSRS